MRREPSLTLRGAPAILGHHEPGPIGKLDKLLGGLILAAGAGAGAGLAAVGISMLAPLAGFAAIWGWLEQKNEAVKLLRQAIDALSDKLMATRGYERRQLIAAAHTTIVVAAFFESFRQYIEEDKRERQRERRACFSDALENLKITDEDKKVLITENWSDFGRPSIEWLYSAEIPAPSATCGYEENTKAVQEWLTGFSQKFASFITLLGVAPELEIPWRRIIDRAVERYRSHYLTLAATVPEFMIWGMLGEHAATRSKITDLRADLAAALDSDREALGRVEKLLALQAAQSSDALDLCSVVERANRGVLDQPIVPMDAERYGTAVEFPTVGRIYINPRYRIAQVYDGARPADENWWNKRQSQDDLDLTLATYMTAPDATRFPLLLLGHPGAGKSLLMKVLAARLPASAYTVVRVPLRKVGANAPIMDQVQQALDLATHRRVDWWRLVEQSYQTVRVVLLDGLDELLQATSNDRSGYLQDVMEYQRVEAEQERPVVVVVTSRTVVADRVDIPLRATVVKLDYFNNKDIERWLHHWHEANASLIESGAVRELIPAAALRQLELAQQPLLLLMLALYSADPASPALDTDLSTANLYQRLVDNFVRREVAKNMDAKLSEDETARRMRDQIERLSVAALAMFNRGRQDITEVELGADMSALNKELLTSRPAELGKRLIAEFFFVHASEARELSILDQADDAVAVAMQGQESTLRCYEFLHATFGEYLVASRIVNELVDVAEAALAGRRGPREPEDDLLFALLSHQPLAGSRAAVNFAVELFANLPTAERSHTLELLEILIESYRCRHGSDRYMAYRPTPPDNVRQLAAYSANLVLLRVALQLDRAGVPLAKMLQEGDSALQQWRSTVNLWRAGLDAEGLQATLTVLTFHKGLLHFVTDRNIIARGEIFDPMFAQLVDDIRLEDRLRYGMAATEGIVYTEPERHDWPKMMASWLIPRIAGSENVATIATEPSHDISAESRAEIATLVMRFLKWQGGESGLEEKLLRFLFSLPQGIDLDTHALAAAVMRHPELVQTVTELQDPRIFGESWGVLCMSAPVESIWDLKNYDDVRSLVELRTWRSHYLPKGLLPREIGPAIDEMLRAYFPRVSRYNRPDLRAPGVPERGVLTELYCPYCGRELRRWSDMRNTLFCAEDGLITEEIVLTSPPPKS